MKFGRRVGKCSSAVCLSVSGGSYLGCCCKQFVEKSTDVGDTPTRTVKLVGDRVCPAVTFPPSSSTKSAILSCLAGSPSRGYLPAPDGLPYCSHGLLSFPPASLSHPFEFVVLNLYCCIDLLYCCVHCTAVFIVLLYASSTCSSLINH